MANKLSVTYTNSKGDSIIFGSFAPFRLLDYTGFGSVENDITSEKVYGLDGEQEISSTLAVREIELTVLVQPHGFVEQRTLVRNLMRIMNPKLPGTLTYQVLDSQYVIDVKIVKGFDPSYTKGVIQFKALSPFWRDVSNLHQTISLGESSNMFKFPLQIIPDFVFAKVVAGNITTIENLGEAAIGFETSITCTGIVINPKLINVYTEEFFGFNAEFGIGDTIYINTNRGEKQALYNGDNAMKLRIAGSTFLQLDNEVTNYFILQAASGVENMRAEIKYEPLVNGV